MIYWRFKDNSGYSKEQVIDALNEGRVSISEFSLIEDSVWDNLLEEADKQGMIIINNPKTNYPVLAPMQELSQDEMLNLEVEKCMDLLSKTDWIYFKCQEEGLDVNVKYAEVIEKRKKARARINEIESITGVTYGNFK